MSFFSDIADSISGRNKHEIQEQTIAAQLVLTQEQLTAQEALDALRMSPERMKQIRLTVWGVVITIAIVVIVIVIKRM